VSEGWRWLLLQAPLVLLLLVLLLPRHIDIASRQTHPGDCVVAEQDAVILIVIVEALREVEQGVKVAND